MADAVFTAINSGIATNPDTAKKIKGVFQWSISGKDYYIDLKDTMKAGPGKAPGKADVTLTLKENDFNDLMSGKAQGQTLFMSGKIKFKVSSLY